MSGSDDRFDAIGRALYDLWERGALSPFVSADVESSLEVEQCTECGKRHTPGFRAGSRVKHHDGCVWLKVEALMRAAQRDAASADASMQRWLEDALGGSKIALIKLHRRINSTSLKDALSAVESSRLWCNYTRGEGA